jgi:hypothetical protein
MLKVLAIILSLTIILSAILAPAVFSLLAAVWPSFPWPYSRVFDRVILIVLLLLVAWRRKQLALPRLKFNPRPYLRTHGRIILLGAAVSTVGSIIALYASVEAGLLAWLSPSIGLALKKTALALLTAGIVSVLEELVFRAVMYRTLAMQFGHWPAAALSSLLYATVHFIAPDKSFVYPGWSPFVGFEYLGMILADLGSDGVVQGVFGLFLVGLVLCESVRRSGGIALAIGLHAGWILALKVSLFLTEVPAGVNFAQGLGRHYFFVAQPATWISLLVVWMLVVAVTKRLCPGPASPVEGLAEARQ